MRTLFSLLMCGLLLYNIMGFPLVYWLEEYLSEERSFAVFPEQLSPEELLILKIPIMIPYQTDWQVAEPAEGRLRRGDNFYQIVEQQLKNDTLYVKCKLDLSARDRYLELVAHVDKHMKGGLPDGKSRTPQLLKNFLKEYLTFNRKHWFIVLDWLVPSSAFETVLFKLPSRFLQVASPPPR